MITTLNRDSESLAQDPRAGKMIRQGSNPGLPNPEVYTEHQGVSEIMRNTREMVNNMKEHII